MSSQGHLSGKLGGGVLAGHPQVLSSYQYETGVPLSNLDAQDPISNHLQQSRDPGLLYHCFKHRGIVAIRIICTSKQTFLSTLKGYITLQIIPDTWSEDASGLVWRPRPPCLRSITSALLRLMSLPYCRTLTAPSRSTLGKLACIVALRQSLHLVAGTRRMLTATCGLQCSPTLGTPWRFHISPSQHTLPMPPPFLLLCLIQPHGLRLTWQSTTQLQSSGVCQL